MKHYCKLSGLRDDLCLLIEDKGINKHVFKHSIFIRGIRIMVYDLVIRVDPIDLSLLIGTVEKEELFDKGAQCFAEFKNTTVIINEKHRTMDIAFTEADAYINAYLKDHDIIAYGDINIEIEYTIKTDPKDLGVCKLIKGWEMLMDQMLSVPLDAEKYKILYKETWSYFASCSKYTDFANESIKLINTLHRFNWLLYGPICEAADIASRFDLWNVYWVCGMLIDALLENITRPGFTDESIESDLLITIGEKKRIVPLDNFEEAFDDLCISLPCIES